MSVEDEQSQVTFKIFLKISQELVVKATLLEIQTRYLEDASKAVKEQAFYMKRAMDADDIKLVRRSFCP